MICACGHSNLKHPLGGWCLECDCARFAPPPSGPTRQARALALAARVGVRLAEEMLSVLREIFEPRCVCTHPPHGGACGVADCTCDASTRLAPWI